MSYIKAILLEGDLGPSFRQRGRTVNDIVGESLPVSAQLGVLSISLALVIGVPAGIIAALNHNRAPDYVASLIAILGVSIPALVMGPLLYWIFALKLGGCQSPYGARSHPTSLDSSRGRVWTSSRTQSYQLWRWAPAYLPASPASLGRACCR